MRTDKRSLTQPVLLSDLADNHEPKTRSSLIAVPGGALQARAKFNEEEDLTEGFSKSFFPVP